MWPDWIEGVTVFQLDQHSGSLEWFLVVGCGLAAVSFGTLAGREWRQAGAAPSA